MRVDYFEDPLAPQANTLVVTVSAVITDGHGNVLLMRHRAGNYFMLPGGSMRPGVTVSQSAQDEVLHETAVPARITRLVGIYSNPRHVVDRGEGEVRQEFSLCFAGEASHIKPRSPNSNKDVLWVPEKRLPELAIHPSIRLRLEHGLAAEFPFYT